MKRNRYILLTALTLLAVDSAWAQSEKKENEVIERELTIEKEFQPIVRDASKVSLLPSVEAPKGDSKKATDYSFWTITGTPLYEVNPLAPAAIGTNFDFSEQRGYVNLSMGNYLNTEANVGGAIIRNENTELNASFDFFNTSGKREGLERQLMLMDKKMKVQLMQNRFNINLNQQVSKIRLLLGLTYNNSRYNLPMLPIATADQALKTESFSDIKPTNNQIKFNAAIPVVRLGENWQMKTALNYSFFTRSYTGLSNDKSATENFGNLEMDFFGKLLGNISGGVNVQGEFFAPEGDTYGMGKITPRVAFELENFRLSAGVAFQAGPKFHVFPDIHMNWDITPAFGMYADWTGNAQFNTFERMSNLCYLVLPNAITTNKQDVTPSDIKIGFKGLIKDALSIELFGGATRYDRVSVVAPYVDRLAAYAMAAAQIKDITGWNYGLKVSANVGKMVQTSLDLTGYSGYKLMQQPEFIVKYNLGIQPINPLRIDLDYQFVGKRQVGLVNEETGNVLSKDAPVYDTMKAVNLLGLKATYNFTKNFAVYVSANNLLNQKYDIWYGVPAQGINFMAGASLNF